MRVFATDGLKNMMGRFGIPEDEPIVNRFVSKAIENAQAKIEGLNFDTRKQTLDYDMVLNTQRETIYARRRKMLLAETSEIFSFIEEMFGADESAQEVFKQKREFLGDEVFADTMRRIILYTTDTLWTEHIETMDYMRSSVNLRAYGQREPIIEYKKEGLRLFKEMEAQFYSTVVTLAGTIEKNNNMAEQKTATDTVNPYKDQKIGRNDPCPCGSGKKYKHCHGTNL
jgi:preprotein translocase subunit SecA